MSVNSMSTATALQAFTTVLQPTELYLFSCTEFAKENRITPEVDESFLGPLQITNPNFFGCHSSGHGIAPVDFQEGSSVSRDTVPLIESENTMSSLLEHVMSAEEPGLSIELWFTPSSVNETIPVEENQEETVCDRIQDVVTCEYFAQSTYMHGPIACTWYEAEGGGDTITPSAYCGFPANRFAFQGDTFDPWKVPILTCDSKSTTKYTCEKAHFVAPQPCQWINNQCRAYQARYTLPLHAKIPLVSIAEGDQTKRDRSKGCPGTGHNFDFRLTQKGRSFSSSHSGYDKWVCNFSYNPLNMMLSRNPEVTQIVVTMNDTLTMSTSVFMNGQLVDKQPVGIEGIGGFNDWNPTMFLQLFSDYDTWHLSKEHCRYMPPFLGGIHLLAMYDKRLSQAEVELAYNNGKKLLSTFK